MELAGLVSAARRWWLMLLAAALVAGAAGLVVASRIQPTYESTMRMLVGPVNSDSNTLRGASQEVQTYAELIRSDTVMAPTIKDLGLDMSTADLADAISVTPNDVTRLLTVTVSASSADLTARIANKLADELIAAASVSPARPESQLSVVDPALVPSAPSAPNVLLIAALAALAGFVAAVIAAFVLESQSPFVRMEDDVRRLGADVIGRVRGLPRSDRSAARPLMVQARPESSAALAYRLVGARVESAETAQAVRSAVVVGAESRDGGAEVAANIAAALAAEGRRVVVVDGSDHGDLTHLLDLDGHPGVEWMMAAPNREIDSACVATVDGLDVVPRGSPAGAAVTMDQARRVVAALQAGWDVIVVSADPTYLSGSALAWASASDVAVVTVRTHRTRREHLAYALKSLQGAGTRLAGVVIHEGPVANGAPAVGRRGIIETSGPAVEVQTRPGGDA